MLIFSPENSARRIRGKTPYGHFDVIVGNHDGPIFNAAGEQIGTLTMEMREPAPALPPQPIPNGYDPQQEQRRMRQGGCCGQPTE